MNIANHITSLLYDNECVVVPGLGGFISKLQAAEIHPIKHQFKPPHKIIGFNPRLLTNDGVLIHRIATSEGINYHDARSKVSDAVKQIHEELARGTRVNLPGLGVLYKNYNHDIVFEQDKQVNYLSSSFGLSSFVSPAIRREGHQLITKKSPVASSGKAKAKPARKAGRYHNRLWLAAASLLLLIGVAWGFSNSQLIKQYYHSYATLVPFFYSSPSEYLANNMDKLSTDSNSRDEPEKDIIVDQPSTNEKRSQHHDIENELHISSKPVAQSEHIEELKTEAMVQADDLAYADPSMNNVPDDPNSADQSKFPETSHEADCPAICIGKEVPAKRFYIIAGAFREIENADNLANRLLAKGFNVECAGQTNGGLWRISYESTNSWSLALDRLQAIRNNEDINAWLFSAN